jgi:hypothetical protein
MYAVQVQCMEVFPYKFISLCTFSIKAPTVEEFSPAVVFFPDFPHPTLKAAGILIIKALHLGQK